MLPARRPDISRLEAFSDAVFAFTLTLLVVSLEVLTSYNELMKLMAGVVPFGASFALLTWIWYEHNVFFRKAYRKRTELGLTALEAFDARRSVGEHLVSAGVGTFATLVAPAAPWPFPVFSGFSYFLMGPAPWIYGVRTGHHRKALEARLQLTGDAAVNA